MAESASPAGLPAGKGLRTLRHAAASCKACPLWRRATQTVFGEGPIRARLFLIGEQPGDREDLEGHPFVGPAGRLLDDCLAEAGIDQKPNSAEIAACRPWLEAEIAAVQPALIVCLGATAAKAVFGPSFRVTRERGRILPSSLSPRSAATVHPSSILRAPDSAARRLETRRFIADL